MEIHFLHAMFHLRQAQINSFILISTFYHIGGQMSHPVRSQVQWTADICAPDTDDMGSASGH